jgi:hypothetical protein
MLLKGDGDLRETWSDQLGSATLLQLDAAWNLFRLGETADKLLGPTAKPQVPAFELDEFKGKLQVGPWPQAVEANV